MALRRIAQDNITNENISSRLNNVKSTILPPHAKAVPKRAALGDLGNKIDNIKSSQNALLKKPGISMGPPQKPVSKTTNIAKKVPLPKKENVVPHKPEAPMKRQESILKNIDPVKPEPKPKSYSSTYLSISDPDANTKNEPQMVTEYLADIFNYLRELECKYAVAPDFLEGHKSTPKMRSILVNWLSEIQVSFKLCLETLHLCVSIIDRYLQLSKKVDSGTLQLVGTAALFVACKYEELYVPSIEDFVYICDDSFTKNQILQTEMKILSKLEFNLGKPLSIHFLRRYSKIAAVESKHHSLSKYILELALLDHTFSSIRPSLQAAAACCLSVAILNDVMEPSTVWNPTLVHYTTHKYWDFKDIVVKFAHIIVKAETSKTQNIRKKYSSSSFNMISLNSKLRGALVKKLTSSPSANKIVT